eukprot:364385-Chlamydomonas_euryale.AAC.1
MDSNGPWRAATSVRARHGKAARRRYQPLVGALAGSAHGPCRRTARGSRRPDPARRSAAAGSGTTISAAAGSRPRRAVGRREHHVVGTKSGAAAQPPLVPLALALVAPSA